MFGFPKKSSRSDKITWSEFADDGVVKVSWHGLFAGRSPLENTKK